MYTNHSYKGTRWWHSHRHPHGIILFRNTKHGKENKLIVNNIHAVLSRKPLLSLASWQTKQNDVRYLLKTDTYSLTYYPPESTLPPLCLAQIMTQAQWMQISVVPSVLATCCTLESQYHPGWWCACQMNRQAVTQGSKSSLPGPSAI